MKKTLMRNKLYTSIFRRSPHLIVRGYSSEFGNRQRLDEHGHIMDLGFRTMMTNPCAEDNDPVPRLQFWNYLVITRRDRKE